MLIVGMQKTTILDYPGRIASIVFTGGCNFRCPYCHNGDIVLAPNSYIPFEENEIFSYFKKRSNLLDGVVISGGEPTLQPDLYDFIKKVRSMGLKVKLDTNGTNPDILQTLLEEDLLNYVAMDIKQCRDKYESITCNGKIDINAIDTSIDLLLSSFIDYEFRTTITKELHTKEDIINIGKWISGAQAYFLQPYTYSESVINPIYSAPSKNELSEYIEILKQYVPHTMIRGENDFTLPGGYNEI